MEPNPDPGILNTVEGARPAVGNPALDPDFAGEVTTSDTRGFWRGASINPVSKGFHWNPDGETCFLIGDRLGRT